MDTTQEPEITLVELDNILAGELDQKWSALFARLDAGD
jgi:hypothetical protein